MSTIALTTPIANGAENISRLNWRAIRLGDYPVIMQAVGSLAHGQLGTFSEDLLNLVAHFAGIPRAAVDQIDELDGQPVLDSLAEHLAAHMARFKK